MGIGFPGIGSSTCTPQGGDRRDARTGAGRGIAVTIREIRWQNFRAFPDTGWLQIRPITVLLGTNNSGKSSILNPLLLLKQTLRSVRAQSALVLRGELINAGSFSDFVHDHDSSQRVVFSLRFHSRRPADVSPPELGVVPPALCELTFQAEAAPGIVSLHRYSVQDPFDRPLLVRTKAKSSQRYSLTAIQSWAAKADGEDAAASATDKAARSAITQAKPNHFLFDGGPVLDEALDVTVKRNRKETVGDSDEDASPGRAEELQLSSFVTKYIATVEFTGDHVRGDLKDVVYLGPLRENPKRLYEISGDAPPDVGIRGQFSPEILLRGRKKPLFRQVSNWLQKFDFPGQLTCEELTETAFRLALTAGPNSIPTNFADLGFGFSQLLPLLVQGLSAAKGTLFITEQPEIHLNPRLQSRLAEFFLQVTKRNSRILVETHSEHIILGLRRLVAEGRLNSSDIAIYFVERPDGIISTVRSVPVQPNGHVDAADWPSGFFEDSLRESFALASAQARRAHAD